MKRNNRKTIGNCRKTCKKLLHFRGNSIIIKMHPNNVKKITVELESVTPSDQSDLFVFNFGQATNKKRTENISFKETKGVAKEYSKIMCKAAEVGKIVINKCIDLNLFIDAQKLQKLLVLMQVDCIRKSKKPLFKEDIRIWDCGVAIKEVDEEFRGLGGPFAAKQEEYIILLEQEEKSVNKILEQFGKLDALELNLLSANQKVISLAVKTDDSTAPHVSYPILMGAFLEE